MRLFLILALFLSNFALAIDWIDVKSVSNSVISLDKDSIQELQGYYFYNIKVKNTKDDIIVTMQCKISHPFCARIKHYKPAYYESLGGNYSNISNEMTEKLEPVTYESRAYASYKKVKQISSQKPKITF